MPFEELDQLKSGMRVQVCAPWKEKTFGLLGTVTHKNHKFAWVRLDNGRTIPFKAQHLKEPDVLDRLADAL